jgi:hypothetical protein
VNPESSPGSTPDLPVQRTELNGFRDMFAQDAFASGQVRDGPGHLENHLHVEVPAVPLTTPSAS